MRVKGADVAGQGFNAGGVVRAVQEDVGTRANAFQAAGPLGLFDAGGIDAEVVERGKGDGGVFDLVCADEGEREAAAAVAERTAVGPDFDGIERGRREWMEGSEDCGGFRELAGGDDGAAGFDDARFLAGDRGQSVAEELLVVVVDGGDDAEDGIDDVGGVQPAAEAGFKDGVVHFVLREEEEGHGGDGFKVRRLLVERDGADLVECLGELVLRDGPAVDADAFGGLGEVGRSVEAGGVAGAAEGGFEEGASGAFSVGSGDVEEAASTVRRAQQFAQAGDAFEAEFDGLVLVAERVEEADRVGVGGGRDNKLIVSKRGRFVFLGFRFVQEADDNGQGDLDLIFREVEDRDLVGRARKGGVDAYNALVSRWEKRIYNYLWRLTGHQDDSMDIAQDVFLKAYQNLARLEDAGRFGPWLYRIAHNEAMSHLRRPQRETELGDYGHGGSSGGRMAPVEVSLAVESALKRLSEEQREAVVLKIYEGFKFDEIAEILNAPASTIKSRVYTGLELLKEMLAPVAGGE